MNWFADFETTTEAVSKDKAFMVCYCLQDQLKQTRLNGVNFDQFWKDIIDNDIDIVYFHNLSWDFEFIKWDLVKRGLKFSQDSKLKENEWNWLKDQTNNIYTAKVSLGGKEVVFKCSYKLLGLSVAKMGAVLGLPKLEADYDSVNVVNDISELPKEFVDYMNRDVEVVIDYFNGFTKLAMDYKLTIGSTSIADFKKAYGIKKFCEDFGGQYWDKYEREWKREEVLTTEEWDEFQLGYRGGITTFKPKWKEKEINEVGIKVDYNSMYPSVMEFNKLPYGKVLKYKPNGSYLRLLKVHIISTYKKDDEMISHLHANDAFGKFSMKYLDECENEVFIYTEREWEELQKTYELVEGINYELVDEWYFRTKWVYRDWIKEKAYLKINAKNKADREVWKLFQNNSYGKAGQNRIQYKKVLVPFDEIDLEDKEYMFGQVVGDWFEKTIMEETVDLSYILIALTITSYARVELIRAIRANKERFIYGDTDSMVLLGLEEPKGIKLHDSEYGAWKVEGTFKKFKVIKPKCYILINESDELETTIAGLPAKAQKLINFDNFYSGFELQDAKLQRKAVEGGLLLVKAPFTL